MYEKTKAVVIAVFRKLRKREQRVNLLVQAQKVLKIQIQLVKFKTALSEIKHMLYGISGRLDIA